MALASPCLPLRCCTNNHSVLTPCASWRGRLGDVLIFPSGVSCGIPAVRWGAARLFCLCAPATVLRSPPSTTQLGRRNSACLLFALPFFLALASPAQQPRSLHRWLACLCVGPSTDTHPLTAIESSHGRGPNGEQPPWGARQNQPGAVRQLATRRQLSEDFKAKDLWSLLNDVPLVRL